jgi:hypothetical protein
MPSEASAYGALIREVADFHGDLVRNIKGIRQSQSLFDDLSADPADQAAAVAAETATRIPTPSALITRPFDYGTVITYPFLPLNWQATRFSDGLAYGVWYGSLALETTVYETAHHWHRFVMDSFPAENREIVGERRVLDVRCDAILVDLRGKEKKAPQLVDRSDYGYTQGVGRYLKAQSQNGVLVRSARTPVHLANDFEDHNAAVLRGKVLSNVREKCFLTYRMNPLRDEIAVERATGERWLQVRPSALA